MEVPLSVITSALAATGTLVVAVLVYRVQADKLFLEMREGRIESLERFNAATNNRKSYITRLGSSPNLSGHYGKHRDEMLRIYGLAERDLSLWFGEDVLTHMRALAISMSEYEQRIVAMHSELDRQNAVGRYKETEQALAAANLIQENLATSAHRYIAAGRRGLPLGDRFRIWRRDL